VDILATTKINDEVTTAKQPTQPKHENKISKKNKKKNKKDNWDSDESKGTNNFFFKFINLPYFYSSQGNIIKVAFFN